MTGDCVTPWREIGRFEDTKDVLRAYEFESLYSLDVLVPSTIDTKLIVCLGTQLICRHQGFLGTTKQDEKKKRRHVSRYNSSTHARRTTHANGGPLRSGEQEDPVCKTHEQRRTAVSIKEDRVHPKTQTPIWCMFLATHLATPNVVKRSLSHNKWLKELARTTDNEWCAKSWDPRTAKGNPALYSEDPFKIQHHQPFEDTPSASGRDGRPPCDSTLRLLSSICVFRERGQCKAERQTSLRPSQCR